MGADLALTAVAWLGTYQLRFLSGVIPVVRGMPPEELYYFSTWVVLPIFHLMFRRAGLYEPWRLKSFTGEAGAVIRSVVLGVAALLVLSFLLRFQSTNYSRLFLMVFVPLNLSLLLATRLIVRWVLRALRRSGRNLRHVLVVGSGPLARQVVDRAAANPWAGLRIVGMLADHEESREPHHGVEVLGSIEELATTLERLTPQQVFIALPFERFARIKQTMNTLADSFASVRIVADLFDFGLVMHGSVDDFDGLPVLNLVDRPAVGMQATVKRAFDVAFSSLVLVALLPLLVSLAIAVRISVKGPVFYRQERMGLDGRSFDIIKFRTMPQGSESTSGPVWASKGDARPTRLGAWLRRTSLDELPQFWNVLKGEMSVVGPRPERPVFIEKFRQEVPRYHQRHMVRAGITGWAQVNGWRGNTELAPRIAHDLYYIENWSMMLDIKIILRTVLQLFGDPNAH